MKSRRIAEQPLCRQGLQRGLGENRGHGHGRNNRGLRHAIVAGAFIAAIDGNDFTAGFRNGSVTAEQEGDDKENAENVHIY